MRLVTLTRKKAEVESQIIKHVQELGAEYKLVQGEFEAVLKGRSEDVRQAIESLRELEEKGTTTPLEQ